LPDVPYPAIVSENEKYGFKIFVGTNLAFQVNSLFQSGQYSCFSIFSTIKYQNFSVFHFALFSNGFTDI